MESAKIGFSGLGMMGRPMALRLLEAGYPLRVYNRTKEKASELLERGAIWCNNPKDLMEQSEVVISMVTDSGALEEVGRDLLKGIAPNKVHVDMSTVSPAATQRLEQEYRGKQATFLHAPVLGSVPQAIEGSLLIFVGGDRAASRRCESLFNRLGRRIWYFEKITQAGHLKLICNLFIASMITALSEALVLGQKAGLPFSTILEVLEDSALGARMYQTKGEAIGRRNFTPRFVLSHMLKDLNLMLESATSTQVSLPVVEAIRELFEEAEKLGLSKEDYSAVIKVLESRAMIEVKA